MNAISQCDWNKLKFIFFYSDEYRHFSIISNSLSFHRSIICYIIAFTFIKRNNC